MTNHINRKDKTRLQVDISAAEADLLELLQQRLSVRSRADLLQQAYGTFLWIVDEMLAGRRVVSVEPGVLDQVPRFKELAIPAVTPVLFEHYRYLVARPDKASAQPYLKGRNMTVGQLVYKMRANELGPEQASADMDLPLEQVLESLAFYSTHQPLVDSEMAEVKQVLLSQGVALEPDVVSR